METHCLAAFRRSVYASSTELRHQLHECLSDVSSNLPCLLTTSEPNLLELSSTQGTNVQTSRLVKEKFAESRLWQWKRTLHRDSSSSLMDHFWPRVLSSNGATHLLDFPTHFLFCAAANLQFLTSFVQSFTHKKRLRVDCASHLHICTNVAFNIKRC